MADAQLKLSRRALLAAACASAPILSATTPSVRFERSREAAPSAVEALRPAWTRSLAAFRSAQSTLAALESGPDEDAFGRAHDR